MKAQLKLASTSTTGKSMTKTISDVNPNASSAQYKTFAQGLNSLTTNTYKSTDLVTTINVDTEQTNKPAPTLSIGTWTKDNDNYYAPVTYNGDGTLTASAANTATERYTRCYINTVEDSIFIYVYGSAGSTYDVVLTATETDNFDYKTISQQLAWN